MDYRELALQDQLRKLEHQKWMTDDPTVLKALNEEIKNISNQLGVVRLNRWNQSRMHTDAGIGRWSRD